MKINWIKYGSYAAILLALCIYCRRCGINSVIKTVGRDTTFYITKTDTIYQPKVTTITNIVYVPKTNWDTLWGEPTVIINPVDTAAILSDYYATRFYRDSQNLKRGSVIISDSVSRNRIVSRRLQTFNTDTTIRITTLLSPPGKIIVYFGIDYLGTVKYPFYATGVNLSLKIPNDRMFTAGILVDKNNKLIYQAGVKVPIRFRIFKPK